MYVTCVIKTKQKISNNDFVFVIPYPTMLKISFWMIHFNMDHTEVEYSLKLNSTCLFSKNLVPSCCVCLEPPFLTWPSSLFLRIFFALFPSSVRLKLFYTAFTIVPWSVGLKGQSISLLWGRIFNNHHESVCEHFYFIKLFVFSSKWILTGSNVIHKDGLF